MQIKILVFLRLLRAHQWAKNLFIFLPLFFSGQLMNSAHYIPLFWGFLSYSLVASSIYIINDINDIKADRQHPKKRYRPLAAGTVSVKNAIIIAFLVLLSGIVLALNLKLKLLFIILVYFVLNFLYSYRLKNIPILDFFIVAVGFNLRIKAGGIITGIPISEWLMIMVFLLSLFMAVGKRRDDIILKKEQGLILRKVASHYNIEFLNSCIIFISSITVVAYLMYSLSPQVVDRLGTYRLYYTSIFVIAGLMRYLQIIFIENQAGSPTSILYKDRFIQLTLILWISSFYILIYLPDFRIF